MVKYYCDRCEKELERLHLSLEKTIGGECINYFICEECCKDFENWFNLKGDDKI